jgi:hypothetical protein
MRRKVTEHGGNEIRAEIVQICKESQLPLALECAVWTKGTPPRVGQTTEHAEPCFFL